jgi:hypothetical protein
VEDAERGVNARVAGAAAISASAEHIGTALADDVHIGLAGVHVRARHEGAAERRNEVAIPLQQAPPLVAVRDRRDREHSLAAAAWESEHGQLAGHSGGQSQRVLEGVRGIRVALQARAAHRRPELGRVQAHEHPGARRGVVTDHRVLPVPPLE